MAGDIWSAIGAALSGGAKTYGALDEQQKQLALQEQERQDRLAQQQAQMAFQQKEFDAQEKSRQAQRIKDAIEGLTPGQAAGDDLIAETQQVAPELMARFKKQAQVTNAGPMVGGGPMGIALPLLQTKDAYVRTPSLQEQSALTQLQDRQDTLDAKKKFETYMGGEGAKADYDSRLAMAQSLGLPAPPKSEADLQREKAADNAQRMKELAVMYPPDRFGPDAHGGANADPAVKQWLAVKQNFANNARIAMKSQFDNVQSPDEAMKLLSDIDAAAEAATVKQLGPMPQPKGMKPPAATDPSADATQHLISTIDEDAQKRGGDYNALLKVVMANQGTLRKQGVDVPSYVRAINAKAQVQNNAPRGALATAGDFLANMGFGSGGDAPAPPPLTRIK